MYDPLLPSDPVDVGGYRLIGRLGAGGMGVVYLAEARSGGRVAVKVLIGTQRMTAQLRSRLAREAASLQRLHSPHIVQVLDVHADAEVPFLVMSYIEGEPLGRAVPAGGMPAEQVRAHSADLAAALEQAHQKGVVHRDVKPNNVILGPGGATLVDFGIASLEDEGTTALTRDGHVLGSLAWLAPEVVSGAAADGRSDVFGLGLVMGYMATGRHPYGTGRPDAITYRVLHEQPDLAGVDETLAAAIAASLQVDPSARPTAREVAEALANRRSLTAHGTGRTKPRRSRRVVHWLLVGTSAATIAGAAVLAGSSHAEPPADAAAAQTPAATQTAAPEQAAASQAPPVESFDFTSSCTWQQREATYDTSDEAAIFQADCLDAGRLSVTATYVEPTDQYGAGSIRLAGMLDGKELDISAAAPDYNSPSTLPYDAWTGTYGGVPVNFMVERDGNGWNVVDLSMVGNGAIRATGPQADFNRAADGPDDVLKWDDTTTVTGRFYGDDNITHAQAAAICNLITVGVPATGLLMMV